MRIHVINPNVTQSMTRNIEANAKAAASPGCNVTVSQPVRGLAAVEGVFDDALAAIGVFQEILRVDEPSIDAFVIACFDDTGLEAARCLTDKPVVGIGEAAFHTASLVGRTFSVITTQPRSVAAIEDNLRRCGLASRCRAIRPAKVSVLDLDRADPEAYAQVISEIERALDDDGAEAIVLGCAGMTDMTSDLAKRFAAPVIDGIPAAIKLVEALVSLGLRTSKVAAYAAPSAVARALAGYIFSQPASGLDGRI